MMKSTFAIFLLLQGFVPPERAAIENPSSVSSIPKSIQKDYDKLWRRFLNAKTPKDDAKVDNDATGLLKKNKDLPPLLLVQAYLALYSGEPGGVEAEHRFSAVLGREPANRIALYYLAEMAYSRNDYVRAGDLYTRLLAVDPSHPELELKRQKMMLLAADGFFRSATEAEESGRLADTEEIYRQSILRSPSSAELHGLLGGVLAREKMWDEAMREFERQIALAGPSYDAQHHIVEALTNLGRTEEAKTLADRIGGAGPRDVDQLLIDRELEDLGRWGTDIAQYRAIESTPAISREQFAALMVRYFPQIADLPRTPQIATDIQDSWASSEIQTVVDLGILDPLANHAFMPSRIVTRGEFTVGISRLTHIVGATPSVGAPIPTTDLTSSSALYQDVQLVLGYGMLSLDKAGKFGSEEPVTGKEAVNAEVQLMRFVKSFQQTPH